LVDGPHFRLDRLDGAPDAVTIGRYAGALLVVPLDCTVTVAEVPVAPGQCALADRLETVVFPASGLSLIAQPR
jgi:mannose-6-phosphate isomerase